MFLRWSDLGPFGPVWLCLIDVERRRELHKGPGSKNKYKDENKTKREGEGVEVEERDVKYTRSRSRERRRIIIEMYQADGRLVVREEQ